MKEKERKFKMTLVQGGGNSFVEALRNTGNKIDVGIDEVLFKVGGDEEDSVSERRTMDNKELRKVLVKVLDAIKSLSRTHNDDLPEDVRATLGMMAFDVNTALATPERNCDVGTSDEQAERFENFCLKHIGCAEETGGRHCVGCPLEKASRNITQKCELYWAQMPYKGEETNG